jgi:glycosyltransferase involved in cell wall biosynthesis
MTATRGPRVPVNRRSDPNAGFPPSDTNPQFASAINSQSSTGGYVVITPVRNEGQYLQKTIDSVVAQTLPPRKWIIVNDGSTDNTKQLIDEAAKHHSWIQGVHRSDRGFRKQGGGVIEAFYDGYNLIASEPWDFLVKLDGDLSFDRGYFESCLKQFADDSKLGIGGGTVCCLEGGALVAEARNDPRFHVRGATKIYRRQCWEQIGGLLKAPGWDTVDELKANMLGWETRTFTEILLLQHKDTGSADGAWRNWVKNGLANYVSTYHPLFMLAKCLKRVFARPYLLSAAGLAFGFVGGYVRRVPRIEDSALTRYIRAQQIRKLTLRPSIWD